MSYQITPAERRQLIIENLQEAEGALLTSWGYFPGEGAANVLTKIRTALRLAENAEGITS